MDSPRVCDGVAKRRGTDKLSDTTHRKAHTMFRAGSAVRFTPGEVEDYRSLGIDFAGTRTQDDSELALGCWAQTLGRERPDLLDKIVLEMAKVKGVRPPVLLSLVVSDVPSAGSPGQS